MSAYAGLRNIIIIGSLYGFHGLINRSLLIDGINEVFLVTARISLVAFFLAFYCLKDFINEINKHTTGYETKQTSNDTVWIKADSELAYYLEN